MKNKFVGVVSLFRKNNISTLLLLLLYIAVVRAYSFLHPSMSQVSENAGVFSKWFFALLGDRALLQSVVAFILIYAQAVYINFQVNKNRLLRQQSALPSMFYALFSSFFIAQQGLTPELLGMTFVLLACFSAYKVYKSANATPAIVNSAIYLAIATLFYPPFSILIVALFVEISVLRSFKFKERLQYVFAILAIYWILGSFLFYMNSFSIQDAFGHFRLMGSFALLRPSSLSEGLPLVLIFLAVAAQLVNYYNFMKKKGIESRKKIDFFFWIMLTAFLSLLLFRDIDRGFLCFLAFPIAVLTSMSFTQIKNNYRAELIHFVLLVLAFWSQYQSYFIDL